MDNLILAHRGSSGKRPENTKAAFEKAVRNQADGVEFDVHLSKDGEIVVIHDEKVDRTTDGSGYIKDLKLAELKNFDAGDDEHPEQEILTLRETLEIVKNCELINIELKNGVFPYPCLEEKVLKIVEDMKLKQQVIISSFNHYSLKKIKELDNDIKTGILYSCGLYEPWVYAQRVGVEAIHPYFLAVNKEIVAKCHYNNIMVNTYGANDKKDLTKLIDMKVDGIITDFPVRARKIKK